MRVAASTNGTLRHVLSTDLVGFPAKTKGLCGELVDIEITRFTPKSIKTMKLCPPCLDLWITHLKSVTSLTGDKADRNMKRLPNEGRVLTLALKPLAALAGRFGRTGRRRKRL